MCVVNIYGGMRIWRKLEINKENAIVKTPDEAIETIKSNMPTSGYQMLRESLAMAIEALEKQKPKVAIVMKGKPYPVMCPTCGHNMDLAYHHCIFCGQKLIYLEGKGR